MWYRPSIRRATVRAVVVAMVLLVLGALALGALRLMRVDFGSPWLAGYAVGIGLVVAGPLYVWRRSLVLMGQERILTIHADGLRWRVGEATPAFVAWTRIDEVVIVEAQLVVKCADEVWRLPLPFEGVEDDAVVRTLSELRQKALLGLPVRPRSV